MYYLFLGFKANRCEEPCENGTYGFNCSKVCNCKNSAECDKVTGKCVCHPGFTGTYCEIRCPSLTYGVNCENTCNCSNAATCDPVNGTCICPPGYTGDRLALLFFIAFPFSCYNTINYFTAN